MTTAPSAWSRLRWSFIKQRLALIVFALPFAGVGLGMLGFGVVPTLLDAARMQSWQLGQAQLDSAQLRVHRGEDSTTYSVHASYRYEYGGRQYGGERVAISSSADNIGGFQEQLGRQLERAHAEGRRVAVWINPEDPSQAVLNRELRWGLIGFKLIFVLVFGALGIGLLIYAFCAAESKTHHPEADSKPWLGRREWASPLVKSQAKTGMYALWGFAAFWNAIAIPSGIMGLQGFIKGQNAALLALLFPAVGMALVVWAVALTRGYKRFGDASLTMDPYPGCIGGQVGGSLMAKIPYDPSLKFRSTLSCLESYVSGSGKNRSRRERVVWQSEGFARSRAEGSATRLELLFDVEPGLPQSQPSDRERYHLWRLRVHADLPGIDFDRSYDIPVFPGTAKAQQLREVSSEHSSAVQERSAAIEQVLDLKQIDGGVELFYPAFRHTASKLAGVFIGLLFVGAGIAAGASGAPLEFPLIFSTVGGAISLSFLYHWLLSLRVRIDAKGLWSEKRLLAWRVGSAQIARANIRGLSIKRSYSSSSGQEHREFYKLQANPISGKDVDIGYNLPSREAAKQALEALSLLTGLPAEDSTSDNGRALA